MISLLEKKLDKRKLIDYITMFFGRDWINENWEKYVKTREKDLPDIFTSESIIEEISLHPLLYLGADSQILEKGVFDFNRVPFDSGNYSTLTYLARDLKLLDKEINARGTRIIKSLKIPTEYDSVRFCILVASAYKLLGYNVEFLPEKSHKTPDLLVSKNNTQFVIECKQKNQRQADKERYEMFIQLVSLIRPMITRLNLRDLSIEIKINVNKNNLLEGLSNGIKNTLSSRTYTPIRNKLFRVKFAKAHLRAHYDQFVNNPDNINKVVYFTRAENAFIFTDPKNKNLIHMNKHYTEDLLPTNLYDLIVDANEKKKDGNKLILHYDFGMTDSTWSSIVANKIYREIKGNKNDYKEIDIFVFSQTIPKHINHLQIIKPDFKIIGKISNLGNIPINMIFGQQGETGMDNYLDLKD